MAHGERDDRFVIARGRTDRGLDRAVEDRGEALVQGMRMRLFRVQRVQRVCLQTRPQIGRNVCEIDLRREAMKLTETKADTLGTIVRVDGDDHFLDRITSIGMTEGTAFQTVRNDKGMKYDKKRKAA